MKYECSADYCLPIPLLEETDLSIQDRTLTVPINRAQMRSISPAATSPTSNGSVAQLKKFDQFWEGTDSITVPGSGSEVGRLFASSNTTSNPSAGPETIDTWVEDWVITDWAAFNAGPPPTTTITYSDTPGTVDEYILGQPAGTNIRRMTLTFQYQDTLPAAVNIPPQLHTRRKIFK
ncbi:MAG: hypothetical protein ACI8RZ_007141, partial [Myxococcota bacterium]